MRRLFTVGGVAAGIVLILFGIGSLGLSVFGFTEVRGSLEEENIVGSPDMEPDAIAAAVQGAGVDVGDLPDCDVAEEEIDTGGKAKCFADYMRIHTLLSTGGETYAEMGRFLDEQGNPTSSEEEAAVGEGGRPVDNPMRQLWVTETALATALNMAYLAENVAIFGIVVGIALILAGVGFIVLAVGALGGLGRSAEAV